MEAKNNLTWEFEFLYKQGVNFFVKEDFPSALSTFQLAIDSLDWKDTNHYLIPSLISAYKTAFLFNNALYQEGILDQLIPNGFYEEAFEYLKKMVKHLPNPSLKELFFDLLPKVLQPFEEHQKFGYESVNGKEVIPAIYFDAKPFHFERAAVHDGIGWQIIDRENRLIVDDYFDEVLYSYNGDSLVKDDGKYNVIKENKHYLLPFWVDEISSCGEDGLYPVKTEGKWGFYARNGDCVVPPMFDDVGIYHQGMACVRLNKLSGFIDVTGRLRIPIIYKNIGDFHEGYAYIKINEKVGFIDKFARLVIFPQFDNTHSFKNGYCPVQIDNFWGLIDKKGEVVIPYLYDALYWNMEEMLIAEISKVRYYINIKGVLLQKIKQ